MTTQISLFASKGSWLMISSDSDDFELTFPEFDDILLLTDDVVIYILIADSTAC